MDEVDVYSRALDITKSRPFTARATRANAHRLSPASMLNRSRREDITANITLTGNDPEGRAQFRVVTLPAHGVLTGTGRTRFPRARPNYFGPDSLRSWSRRRARQCPATVSITVPGMTARRTDGHHPKIPRCPSLWPGARGGRHSMFGVITPPRKAPSGMADLTYRPTRITTAPTALASNQR